MLEHVTLWMGNTGWVRVTPEQVISLGLGCPITPQRHLLRCDICKNYVHLTDNAFGRTSVPYFKHHGTNNTYIVNGKKETCPDIVGGPPTPSQPPPNPDCQEIPVYLVRLENRFEWEVRLPPIPDGAKNFPNWNTGDLFRIDFETTPPQSFSFRLKKNAEGIRFRIGANPPEECIYTLSRRVGPDWRRLLLAPARWHLHNSDGFGKVGKVRLFNENSWAAFSGTTGRLLPLDADVGVGEWVYFATMQRLEDHDGITIEHFPEASGCPWQFARAKARTCSRDVADWFRRYNLYLTSVPTDFLPVWPPSVSSPNLRMHRHEEMFFLLHGCDSAIRLWPPVGRPITDDLGTTELRKTEKIVLVKTQQTFCTLVADRWGTMLKSEFLWKRDPLTFKRPTDEVHVKDIHGEDIPNGAQLPSAKRVFRLFDPAFDGRVMVRRGTECIAITPFKAGNGTTEFKVDQGETATIFFARDSVWSASVDLRQSDQSRTGNASSSIRVPFSHAMAAVLHRLPNATAWRPIILSAVRQGWMDSGAYTRLLFELNHSQGETR